MILLKLLVNRINKRLNILQPSADADEYGQQEGREVFAVRWGSIEPLRGRELFAAQQFRAEVTTRIRLRYDAETKGINKTMMVEHRSRVFEILYVIHPEFAQKEIQLMCKEVD